MDETPMFCEPLGKQEMPQLFDVHERTPHLWHTRDQLPPPDYESVNGCAAWDRDTLVLWAAATGRLSRLRHQADRDRALELIDQGHAIPTPTPTEEAA